MQITIDCEEGKVIMEALIANPKQSEWVLREYSVRRSGNIVECWITAREGEAFEIHCHPYVDGTEVDSGILSANERKQEQSGWLDGYQVSEDMARPFQFGTLELTDDENMVPSTRSGAPYTIRVVLEWGRSRPPKTRRKSKNARRSFGNLSITNVLHKKHALVGNFASVTLGEPVPSEPMLEALDFVQEENTPTVEFIFRYGSESWLKENGIKVHAPLVSNLRQEVIDVDEIESETEESHNPSDFDMESRLAKDYDEATYVIGKMARSGAPENGQNGQSGQLDTGFSFPTGGGSAPGSPVEYREPLPLMETVIQKRQRSRSKSKEAGRTQPGPKSFMDLIALTISMAGAQVTWTVELGYGTPFLRDLGLSSTLTSLVWLAGPLSGLIAQPLIGAVSDSSTSKYRRRYWVAASTIVLFVAAIGLAFAIPFARGLVSLFYPEPPVPDRQWDNSVRQADRYRVAVLCFYLLDFALNALQASLRNLLLDVTPGEQLTTANAWHGRMIHAGNIVGFALGGVVLENWPVLRWFGGDQFRKVCIVTMVILAATVWITLVTQEEREREIDLLRREDGRLMDVIKTIWHASLNLPRPIRRVCYVQLCAWVGWFPFLFFGTTWMGVVMSEETGTDPTKDEATVAGDKAMLIYSVVAVIAGTLLPTLASRDQRLLLPELPIDPNNPEATADAELARVRDLVRQWRSEAAREGRPLKLPTMPFMLRNIWTGALLLFFVLMMSTFFVKTVWAGTLVISLLGICWAVACWVPFAIIMEYLKEMDDSAKANRVAAAVAGNGASTSRPGHSRVLSTPAHPVRRLGRTTSGINPHERTALLRRYSMNMTDQEMNNTELNVEGSGDVAGGTILGIHNLAIVLPQFFVSIASSIIFRIFDGSQTGDTLYLGKHGVSWVLRFGGVIALIGAAISRRVPPTKTEKAMRKRWAEIQEEENAGTP
ncbi:mfs general substrate transporter [Rhizoctonia solani]|uniref:Mfs general substrate transporter n=1 Tax=Rhizoctonia solani TaxID=456999 RepID=A0A8H7M882_9AGAM|nr:mfs general substrate transporter [Rhizoctonia solani]